MQALLFYLLYPLIYFVALLPFRILYLFSDFLCLLLKISGYRKKVIYNNLKNSFPDKSDAQIKQMSGIYYQYLCDLILETLKTLTMSDKQARQRCTFEMPDWLSKLHQNHKSVILVMGHYGNWEWAGPSFSLHTPYQLVVIYRPLANPYFEKMMCKMRTKFGTQIVSANNTLRFMVSNKNNVSATAFIADQAASAQYAYWTTFLNQDTAVFTGPEKIAKKFDYPVVYINIQKKSRGYYQINAELLCENPAVSIENQILENFTQRLEKEIKTYPYIWLWSHKRWKHKRAETNKT